MAEEIPFFTSAKIENTNNKEGRVLVLAFHKSGLKFRATLNNEYLGITKYGQSFRLKLNSVLRLVEKHSNYQVSWVIKDGSEIIKVVSNGRDLKGKLPEKIQYFTVRSPNKSLQRKF